MALTEVTDQEKNQEGRGNRLSESRRGGGESSHDIKTHTGITCQSPDKEREKA